MKPEELELIRRKVLPGRIIPIDAETTEKMASQIEDLLDHIRELEHENQKLKAALDFIGREDRFPNCEGCLLSEQIAKKAMGGEA